MRGLSASSRLRAARWLLTLVGCLTVGVVAAQTEAVATTQTQTPAVAQTEGRTDRQPWEDYLATMLSDEEMAATQWEETYELLCQLQQQPMNLNTATRDALEQLPFLSARQVEELLEYRARYGPMKSAAELMMITSIDYDVRRLLSCFVVVEEPGEQEREGWNLKRLLNYGHHELIATIRVPFYERKGDSNGGYAGYPYRHWMRYQFKSGDKLKMGFIGSQDAGEPFFTGKNRLGYDFYSYYLQLQGLGPIETLTLGNYRIAMGQGLILNNSVAFGKMAMLQSLARTETSLRAHSSRSAADYLRGAAVKLRLSPSLRLTAFASYRPVDATLNDDGTAATLLRDGYHRTKSELEKKNNTHIGAVGASVNYRRGAFRVGANAVSVWLDRELKPNTKTAYRRFYPRGRHFLNVSTDYRYDAPRLAFSGETAVNGEGRLATINSLRVQMGGGGEWDLLLLQRFYSYRYTAPYAQSFSDGGRVQNESGLYAGISWKPSARWKVVAYTDYAYFPWVKYRVSQSSHAWDNTLQLTWQQNRWTFDLRYRLRLRQRDASLETTDGGQERGALLNRREHRLRLTASFDDNQRWSSRTQFDFSGVKFTTREGGWMVSQNVGYRCGLLRLNGGVGYFHTEGYESRVLLYEPGPLYTYCFSPHSGEGVRCWLMGRLKWRRLALAVKIGSTLFLDRPLIGSGLQQIDSSHQTDLDLQLHYKL